jgi:hypothetical protein
MRRSFCGSERAALSSLRDLLPGVPLVESPLFPRFIDALELSPSERQVAIDLHRRGYAVIDFPDEELDDRIERVKAYLTPLFGTNLADPDGITNCGGMSRVQDAWIHNEDVRAIAANQAVLDLLEKLYGRQPFPFQTLNFPVGTQQPLHSDSIHFSTIPERFMCGVWLAMEDISAQAGPLTYLPGSHKWPILNNAMLGRRGSAHARESAQAPFEKAWEAIVAASDMEQEVFLAQKGQALIWAANLLHGGSPQLNPNLTRWSQVTHYYFTDCIYYTPAFSDEALGSLDLRMVVDVQTEELQPNSYVGEHIEQTPPPAPSFMTRLKARVRNSGALPPDFDSKAYYRLNPDVAAAKLDAAGHYLNHGKAEGRRYRYARKPKY